MVEQVKQKKAQIKEYPLQTSACLDLGANCNTGKSLNSYGVDRHSPRHIKGTGGLYDEKLICLILSRLKNHSPIPFCSLNNDSPKPLWAER